VGGVHEKPGLPEAFHERHMREFDGENPGLSLPPPPPKKPEFGIVRDAISRCLGGILHSSVSSYLIFYHVLTSQFLLTPPNALFLCKFGQITSPIFSKSGGTYPPRPTVAPPMRSCITFLITMPRDAAGGKTKVFQEPVCRWNLI